MADIEANIGIGIDTSNALAAIRGLQREISAFQKQLQTTSASNAAQAANLQRSLISDINATGKFAARLKTIKSSTETFTTALEKNKLSMGEYFRYGAASTKAFSQNFVNEFNTIEKVARERVKTLQTQYISLGRDANGALKAISVRPLSLDMNDLATKTAIAAQKQQIFNQLLKQGSTNLLNFGKNTQWAGRQLMVGFTIPLSIFGTTAAQTFMKMEEQAIRFKRVYGELFTTEAETNAMAKQIQELALEFTKYGVAVEGTMSLAADAAAMGKMGADLTAQVAEATRLAVLGNVEQAQALETTISLTNAFGTAADELAQKINFLNAVENQTVTSIEDLTIAIPKAGPVIKQLGGNVEDLAFFLTAMKEGGINASEGANALKSGLASLINPTDKASEMLLGFGINIQKIVDANKGDVRGIVLDFAAALDTLDPTTRARAIEQLFGKFQFSRLSTLFQNVIQDGTQAQRVLELANATTGELAALSERELGRLEESTSYKFQKAVADLQAAIAPVGEDFLKAITPVIEFATKILNAFNNMDAGVRQFVVTATAVLGGLGPILIMTFGLLANGVANALKGFAFLRERFLGLGNQSNTLGDQLDYMTQQQLEAAAVAASLEQVHSTLIQRFTSERDAVDALTAAYRRNASALAGLNVAPIPTNIGRPRKMKDGGIVMVPGSGKGDKVPAMLEPGEAIIPGEMVKKYGGLINGMIADSIPGYQKGRRAPSSTEFAHVTERETIPVTQLLRVLESAPGKVSAALMATVKDYAATFGDTVGAHIYSGLGFSQSRELNVGMRNNAAVSAQDFLSDFQTQGIGKWQQALNNGGVRLQDVADELLAYDQQLQDGVAALVQQNKNATITSKQFAALEAEVRSSLPATSKLRTALDAAANGLFEFRINVNEADVKAAGLDLYSVPSGADPTRMSTKKRFRMNSGREARAGGNRVIRSEAIGGVQLAALTSFNDQAASTAQTASESKRTKKIAKDTVDGYVNELERGQKRARQSARRVSTGGAVKFDERSGQYMSSAKFEKQQAARQEASNRVTNMAIGSMTNFANKIQGASFAVAGIAGVMTMFGGTVGEIGGILFQLSGAIGSLILVTQLLITAKMKEAAASAVAGLGGPKGMLGGAGLLKNIGTVLSAAVPNLMRFIPVIGAVVAGLGVLGFVIEQINKQKEKVEGLGNAAFATGEKIGQLGSAFGFTPKTSALPTAFQGQAAVSPEAAAQASAMAASEEFKTQWSKEIEAIKSATPAQADAILYSLAQQLSVSGAPADVVQAIIKAITEAAGQTSLNLSFAKIDFSSGTAKMAVTEAVNLFKKDADAVAKQQSVTLTGGVQVARNPQIVSQLNKENAAIAAGAFASDITALNMQLMEGTISADQFNVKMGELSTNFASLGEQGQKLVLPDLIAKFGPDAVKTVEGIKSMEDSFKLLQAAAAGLDPTTVQNIAAAIKEGQDSTDPEKTKKYKAAQDQLNKVLKTQANVTAENVKRSKEKLKQDELQAEFTASTDAIQADIDAILEQNAAYEDLIAKGWSVADALAAVRSENFMNAYAAAANATAQQQVIDKFKELLNITKTSPVTAGGGGGPAKKSPYEEAVEQLREQRKEIINTNVAYNKLTKAGLSAKDAFAAAQDPMLAAAVASTKVGTDKWEKLLKLINLVNAATQKQARQQSLLDGKTLRQQTQAFTNMSSSLQSMGLDLEDMQNIMSDEVWGPAFAKDFMQDGVLNTTDVLNKIKQIQKQKDVEFNFNLTTKEGAASEFQKIYDKVVGFLNEQKVKVELDFQAANAADEDIVQKAEDQIAALQYKIDDYEAGLSQIQDKEDAVNEKYDARQKSLDKIQKTNERIARQQKGQLAIADALAQGDLAAAASAMQEASAQKAQDAADAQKEALDIARQKELAALTSADGKTRAQLEADIKKVKQEIFDIEEKTLEPARERIRLREIDKREAIDALDAQILKWDQLQNKVNLDKLKLTPEEMAAMEAQAKLIKDLLENWDNIEDKEAILKILKKTVEENTGGQEEPATTTVTPQPNGGGGGAGGTQEPISTDVLKQFYGKNVAGLINNLDSQARAAKVVADRAASTATFKASGLTTAGFIRKVDSVAEKNAKTAKAVADSTAKFKATGLSLSAYMRKASGGMIKRYAAGGFAMGTDIVPAALTPGEFVVRKYAVDNFGVDKLKAINNGTYNGDSMYNYEVNVNVKSDANPDQIAKAVMTQIKQIDSQRIRSNRY